MAQITHSDQGTVDRLAAEILHKAAGQMNKNVTFNVDFSATDSHQKQVMNQKAQVWYNQGKYRVVLSDQEIISDGVTVWQWNKAARELAISKVANDEVDLLNPGKLLANYDKSFKAKYIRTENNGMAIVDLQPRSAQSYHKIRLFIGEKTGILHRMEVHRFDSGRELYNIAQFKTAHTPATMFTFDISKHKDLEIIDMR